MKHFKLIMLLLAGIVASGCTATSSNSASGPHKVVIQVSSKNPLIQKIAVNNAVNVLKAYGPGEVVVEIVAYGPGLSMLTKKNKQSKRIQGLALNDDLTFSACNNTMKKIKKKKGKMPKLTQGVKIVPAGVVRIISLHEQGYAYVRP